MPFDIRTRADDIDKHSADVTTLLYCNGKLYSGADDGKIKVWEEDLKKVTEVQAHETTVFCLAASSDTLYSCSNDGMIKSWGLNDLKEKGVILKEESEVLRLFYADGLLYSSDDQGVVRVHAGNTVKCMYNTLEPMKGLIIVDNIMYTVRDLDVVITELTGDKGNFSLRQSFMGRFPMCIAGDKLCFSSRDGKSIFVHENSHDLHYKQMSEVKNAHEMIINALVGTQSGNDTFLYSAGWDKVVKQWKIEKDAVKFVSSCNADMVVNVLEKGEKGELYAGGSDGHIVRMDL